MKKIKEINKINDEESNIDSKEPTALVNNDENTENHFIKESKNIMIKQEQSSDELTLEETFILRYSDPINSIALTDDHLLFGSMIGKVILYNIPKKKTHNLYEMTNENVVGCSLETKIGNKKIFYVSIGDESVISLEEKENENGEMEIQSNSISNYDSQEYHLNNCTQAFTMLWKNKSLIIFLYHATKHDEEIVTNSTSYYLPTYSIKSIQKELIEEGTINMSNYSVPFDFRHNCFLFLEYINKDNIKDNRDLCIYRFKGKKSGKDVLMNLDQNFGHISFAKILNKNLILIVRNYNLIEIYNIENGNDANILGEFSNESEINSIDFYEVNNNEKNTNENKSHNDEILSAKLRENQSFYIVFLDENENIVELKFKSELNMNNKQNLEVKLKKNINEIKGISEELKNKGLFNLDFPYYIKNSPKYIALTTDQACFLFKKTKNI